MDESTIPAAAAVPPNAAPANSRRVLPADSRLQFNRTGDCRSPDRDDDSHPAEGLDIERRARSDASLVPPAPLARSGLGIEPGPHRVCLHGRGGAAEGQVIRRGPARQLPKYAPSWPATDRAPSVVSQAGVLANSAAAAEAGLKFPYARSSDSARERSGRRRSGTAGRPPSQCAHPRTTNRPRLSTEIRIV